MYWDANYSNCAGGSSSSRVEEGRCCQLQMPQLTIWAWFAKLVCQTELPLFASASPCFFPAFFEHGLMIRWGLNSVWSIHIVLCHCCSNVSLYLCSRVPCQKSSRPCLQSQMLRTRTLTVFPQHGNPKCTIPKCFLALRWYLRICWWACAVSPDALAG